MILERVTDTSLSRLPHPVRVLEAMPDFEPMMQESLGRDWPAVKAAFMDQSLVLTASLRTHADPEKHPDFRNFVASFGEERLATSTEQGALLTLLMYLRYRTTRRPHFVVDDSLVELLSLTDIADDVPVSYLTPPYPGLYLELGKLRNTTLVVPNLATGNHILEGAYIEQGLNEAGASVLQVVLIGSPLGKDGPLDDATISLSLSLADPDRSLSAEVLSSFERGRAASRVTGLRETPASFIEPAREALLMIAKVLLYLNMPETRRTVHAERTAAEQDVARLKSAGKKAKALRRMGKTYDYVLISSPAPEPGVSSAGRPQAAGGTVRAHFRRGHLRMQAHGPQHSLRKVIHIKPVLVGMAEEGMAAPTYVVR